MTELSMYEQEWRGVLEELRSPPEIEVSEEQRGKVSAAIGDADKAFSLLADWEGITLPADLKSYFLRFSRLGSCWWFESADSKHSFGGEFHLTHLYKSLRRPAPIERWSGRPWLSQSLLTELHDFDGTPHAGVGHLALLRIVEGETDPEVWFDAHPYGPFRMDLDYGGYLSALRITKGTFGWQYLYVDPSEVQLSSREFESTGKTLTSMIEVFPELFPGHDYTPLRARLEARL